MQTSLDENNSDFPPGSIDERRILKHATKIHLHMCNQGLSQFHEKGTFLEHEHWEINHKKLIANVNILNGREQHQS